MNTIEDFVDLVRDELGLPVTTETIGLGFDQIEGWDSVLLLVLLTTIERETGRRVSLPDVLEAASLEQVYRLVADDPAELRR
ncbi:phosphopantetheine-binding protein [Actinomadura syzygii]|uniref:Acyl carrier protein n=1 Tax=Actinomadura syzygii TaxID=1427538 RepID=A0A5D0TYA9_9ACTN|nr:phosphopantetheine-binding protein [Actinomadura syzygii]TYC10302.1 acyl carrier protein [Actinomadura syzygii]